MSRSERLVAAGLADFAEAWRRSLSTPDDWVIFDRVDSTQRRARAVLDRHFDEAEEPAPFAMAALAQDAGRGRHGRPWVSDAGLGIYATLAAPVADAEHLAAVPMAVAVALARELSPIVGDRLRLKWPNDLLVERRKLGGILCESIARGRRPWVLVGFGINHGHPAGAPPHPNATSIAAEVAGAPPPLARLAARLVNVVSRVIGDLEPLAEIAAQYRAWLVHRPGDELATEIDGVRVTGRFAGIDDHGFLQLETDGGPVAVRSGEVSER